MTFEATYLYDDGSDVMNDHVRVGCDHDSAMMMMMMIDSYRGNAMMHSFLRLHSDDYTNYNLQK